MNPNSLETTQTKLKCVRIAGKRRNINNLPLNEGRSCEKLMSIPACKITSKQVSPSIPTHTDTEPSGPLGLGTLKVPVTDVKVPCNTSEQRSESHSSYSPYAHRCRNPRQHQPSRCYLSCEMCCWRQPRCSTARTGTRGEHNEVRWSLGKQMQRQRGGC